MDIAINRARAAVLALVFSFGIFDAVSLAHAQSCDLSTNTPAVTGARNQAAWEAYQAAPAAQKDALKAAINVIALGDVVTVTGTNFASLFAAPCVAKSVVLYFNGLPMSGLTPRPPANPASNELSFTLTRANAAMPIWLPVLGSPAGYRPVKVSVGFADGYAMSAASGAPPVLQFDIVPAWRLVIWAVVFFVMVALFIRFAIRSNIIRDPAPAESGARATFSLSRAQGAWWFFIILGAYLFIGIITGDFSDSLNGTALTLIGIGAGTVIGSAVIDAQKDTPVNRAQTTAAITDVSTRLVAATGDQKLTLDSQLKKLKTQSEDFFTDILSDANGISFHRFQIFAWTIVLGIIFVVDVYANLAMPTFNQTLLGLMGVSAGAYLGLKIPEATTPTK